MLPFMRSAIRPISRTAGMLGLVVALTTQTGSFAARKQPENVVAKTTASAPIVWHDVQGHSYGLQDIARSRATVFLFTSTQCPLSNLYTPRMIELAHDYSPQGVKFFLVNSNREDSLKTLQSYAKQRAFPFPAVKDNGTALADRLGARVTPEAIVVDSNGTIRYRGRIDDNQDRSRVVVQDTRVALNALLDSKPIRHAQTLAAGCAIFRDAPQLQTAKLSPTAVTYSRDVAPILNRSCVGCHRTGEVAPFPLQTYAEARTWSAQIRDYTTRKLMPPWKAVPGYGNFHDARNLSDTEIATLTRWVNSGAPMGNPHDLPPSPRFPDPSTWSLGTPDLVTQPVRPYHLEADGKDVYRNFVLPVDFKEDTYISAMEFKPDNRAVVHHIVAYIDPSGQSAKMDGQEKEPGYTVPGIGIGVIQAEFGEVWVPGRTPRFMPSGVAIKIPAGAKLVMQVHYHKNGAPQTDCSRVALYYAKGVVDKTMTVFPLGDETFVLKPGDSHHEVHSSFTLPIAVTVRTMFPHMHLLGREMKVMAKLPDGTTKPLIWVNDWDFNWQETYEYKEPISLPKGTQIVVDAVYDNSEHNPHQLNNPPKEVRFGEQTTDEMCFAIIGMTFDQQKLGVDVSQRTK